MDAGVVVTLALVTVDVAEAWPEMLGMWALEVHAGLVRIQGASSGVGSDCQAADRYIVECWVSRRDRVWEAGVHRCVACHGGSDECRRVDRIRGQNVVQLSDISIQYGVCKAADALLVCCRHVQGRRGCRH